ncbi:Protein of unknown function [Cotesia congregata]|uniref:Uncharacterized protein n=1 Tax=Cotesia congregata TaxID=51543 RepID=A0A8J2HJZ4_COTCN|nr:Protein of unknown function [Cotesia congregata]
MSIVPAQNLPLGSTFPSLNLVSGTPISTLERTSIRGFLLVTYILRNTLNILQKDVRMRSKTANRARI